MYTELPLPVHRRLPVRPIDRERGVTGKTKAANTALFRAAHILNPAYERLVQSAGYQRLARGESPFDGEKIGPIDPQLLPLLTILNRVRGLLTAESCQGLYHKKNAPLVPYIIIDRNPSDHRKEFNPALAFVATFLKHGPQDTFYPWKIEVRSYYERPSYWITSSAIGWDLEVTSPSLVPKSRAYGPVSKRVVRRVRLDLNALSLGLLLMMEEAEVAAS